MFHYTSRTLLRIKPSILSKMLFSRKLPGGYKLVVEKDNVDDTLEFISSSFIHDEPVTRAMEIEDHSDLLRFFKTSIAGSTAVKVVDNSTCQTVAMALCNVARPGSTGEIRTFADCSTCDYKTKRLLNLVADVMDSPNLFDCFKVQKIMEIFIVSTAPSVRGKGFSKLLVEEAKLQGIKEGLTITRMDCTSYISARLASSMKFVTLPPRHILTYRDKKGTPWLPKAPPHPHGHVVISYDFLT